MLKTGKIGIQKIKNAKKLVLYNWRPLTEFEILYKVVTAVIFTPLLLSVFQLAMSLAGYAYLTLENVISFVVEPSTLLILAVLLLLAAACAMLDISAMVFVLDQSAQKQHVTFCQIVVFAVKNSVRSWRRKNVLIVPVVLLLLPFVNIGLASSFLTTISIPEFILDFILKNRILSVLFAALVAALIVLSVRWMYAFFYFTLEQSSFSAACKKSATLGRGTRLRDFGWLILMQLGIALLDLLLQAALIIAALLIGKLLSGIFLLEWLGATAVWVAVVAALVVITALSVPLGYGCVGILFYGKKLEVEETVIHAKAPQIKDRPRLQRLLRVAGMTTLCAAAAGSLALGFLISDGMVNPNIEYVRMTEVTGHRGASEFYPENTMASFRGAKALGADWVELDVQQSKDGQIFVLHDTNLARTTGVNADTWTMNYDEIAKLDAGSFFSKDFAGERIPLLSEVVDFAKENDVKLNIELKPTGYETDFEKCVVDEIRAAGMENRCVITSQVYEVLENVKAYDESITTVYVMSLAYGDISQLTAADHFSVEASNVTETLVSQVHNAGKQLYVWTVNKQESILQMIDLNVDNIITDNIKLAKRCVYESRYSSLLAEFLKFIHA